MQQKITRTLLPLLALLLMAFGITQLVPDSLTASSTVNGRELPIYCVQTDKPQIALTFDAAWAGCY